MRQFRKFLELLAICDVLNFIVRKINCTELEAVFKALHHSDLVVGEVEHGEFAEVVEVLHARDLVLMEVQASHSRHVIHALDLSDSIAFKPNRLDIGVGFQVLNRFKT